MQKRNDLIKQRQKPQSEEQEKPPRKMSTPKNKNRRVSELAV